MSQQKKPTILIFELFKKYLINLLSILILIIFFFVDTPIPDRVIFLDVGQGDAILIQLQGKNILIDGGPDDSVIFKLSEYLKPWDQNIDVLILTHPHGDHIEGVNDIVRRFNVRKLLIYPVCYIRADWKSLMDVESLIEVGAGYTFSIDIWDFKILWPIISDKRSGVECFDKFNGNVNNDSIVVLMESRETGKKLLFTGDAENEVEEFLVSEDHAGLLRNVTVLKAGHHCSNTSSSWNFLFHTDPDLVICSVGAGNKFGHPGEETVERFSNQGVVFLRTDIEGDIVISL